MNLGYGKYQAEDIIRKAKAVMVSKGYAYYLNKRLGRVPVGAVESVLGIELESIAKRLKRLVKFKKIREESIILLLVWVLMK